VEEVPLKNGSPDTGVRLPSLDMEYTSMAE
jgi:hypothetical protein